MDNADLPTLKYAALASAIEGQIASGVYKPGDRLPPERQLAKAHKVAPLTARQALQVLKDRGLIIRRQGSGTFVSSSSARTENGDLSSAGAPTVFLLGLSPNATEQQAAVNWEVRLLRYQGIVEAGFKRGLAVQCHEIKDQGQNPAWLVETFKHAAGIILHDHGNPVSSEGILALRELGIPIVAINRYTENLICSEVRVDVRQGARAAVSHLASLGHERIGLIVGDQDKTPMRLRLEGYRDALMANGLAFDEALVCIDAVGSAEGGAAGARALLAQDPVPTAIFAATDQRAIGVYAGTKELGLRIPADLAVVGFDNLHRSLSLDPPLTTVNNPLYQSGQEAIQLLDELRQQPGKTLQLRLVEAELVVRQSCGHAVSQAS